MNFRNTVLVTLAIISGVATLSLPLLTRAQQSNNAPDGATTEKSTQRMPIRLPANKNVPPGQLKKQEEFTRALQPGSNLEDFKIMTYQDYLKKYANGISGSTDISPDRMVAVMVVNFPKGVTADNGRYSKAKITVARDAETGENISYEIIGTLVEPFGAQPVFDDKGNLLNPQPK